MNVPAWAVPFTRRGPLVELFVWFNLAFLALDIYVAHSVNAFAHRTEWIPLWFSIVAAVALLPGVFRSLRRAEVPNGERVGLVIGGTAILLGVGGLLLHMNSQFFIRVTMRSLVYTAPLAAPLAYSGLGFLLLLNRMVEPDSDEWGRWVTLFAAGGFVGNLALTALDHAQNSFFHPMEWLAVISTALGAAFLIAAVVAPHDRPIRRTCLLVMAAQVPIGLLGVVVHALANLEGPSALWWDNFVFGAPSFAPLMLPNIALLALIGLSRAAPRTSSG